MVTPGWSTPITSSAITIQAPILVLANDVPTLNARAVMNGVMAAEVELVLAKRTGIDITAHVRFDKHRQAIHRGLTWLDATATVFPTNPVTLGSPGVHVDHLLVSKFVDMSHPRLADVVANLSRLPYVAASALR